MIHNKIKAKYIKIDSGPKPKKDESKQCITKNIDLKKISGEQKNGKDG